MDTVFSSKDVKFISLLEKMDWFTDDGKILRAMKNQFLGGSFGSTDLLYNDIMELATKMEKRGIAMVTTACHTAIPEFVLAYSKAYNKPKTLKAYQKCLLQQQQVFKKGYVK